MKTLFAWSLNVFKIFLVFDIDYAECQCKQLFKFTNELSHDQLWCKMEAISRAIKVQLPNYLKSLPVPSTFGGFLKLTGKEWMRLAPLLVAESLLLYLVISWLLRLFSKPAAKKDAHPDWINKTQQKDKEKVADTIQIEDLAEKAAYHAFCRCWKSKKVKLAFCKKL